MVSLFSSRFCSSLFFSFWFIKVGSVRLSVAIRYESRRFKWCDFVRFGHRNMREISESEFFVAGWVSLCWNWLGVWDSICRCAWGQVVPPARCGVPPQKRRVSGWVDPICVASWVAGCLPATSYSWKALYGATVPLSSWRCARWQEWFVFLEKLVWIYNILSNYTEIIY
jgi:hypothetical protein